MSESKSKCRKCGIEILASVSGRRGSTLYEMSLALILLIGVRGSAAAQESPFPSRENIRVVHQDLSKWDKNGDGKLTGAERDAFLRDKRKEAADAEAAARA
jgi:hypothetical protein